MRTFRKKSSVMCTSNAGLYSRRVLAIWNHCVPPPLHQPPPAATAQGQKFPQDDSIIGQALNLPIHFQSSGAQIVVVAVARVAAAAAAVAAPSAATQRQAAAACVPSHDSLEKLVEKQIFFSFFSMNMLKFIQYISEYYT